VKLTDADLSYDDKQHIQIRQHRLASCRRPPTPIWATNQTLLRQLLVRFMELRAGVRIQPGLTESERLAQATARLVQQRRTLTKRMERLARAYVKRPCWYDGRFASPRKLETQIRVLDAQLCLLNSPGAGAGTLLRVVQLYFGVGWDSVAVAHEVGIRPEGVRQLIHRLHRVWRRMATEELAPIRYTAARLLRTKVHQKTARRSYPRVVNMDSFLAGCDSSGLESVGDRHAG
jgi:hypothetical protein